MLKMKSRSLTVKTITTALALTMMPGVTVARDTSTPDWPCVQRKVENLAAGQIWDGPSIEGLKGWWSDKPTMNLINVLAARRTAKKDAEKAIKDFAASQSDEKRDAALTLVFAGLFDKVNGTRRGIMSGIERYFKAQEKRALKIEEMGSELAKLESAAETDEASKEKYKQAKTDYDWASRIFQERQSNMPLACEVPVLIDQHLFQMARLIRQAMNE